MSERKFPSLDVSGLAIHTTKKFPSNLGCRDDKQRDVAQVLWDSESETETITEDYEEACDWAALFAAAPRLLEALERVVNHVGHYGSMPHAHPDAYRDHAFAREAIALAKGNKVAS